MKVAIIGLDIAKHVFQLHGTDASGRVVLRRKLRRQEVMPFFANLPSCKVGLEACGGAHYWARRLSAIGHRASDGSTVREAIREVQQKRRQRCGGYLRSGSAPKYAVCTSKR